MRNVLAENMELFENWQEDDNDEKIKLKDYTWIKQFLYAGFILQAFRLFVVIASVCFFFSMLFKVILELQEDIVGHLTLT